VDLIVANFGGELSEQLVYILDSKLSKVVSEDGDLLFSSLLG